MLAGCNARYRAIMAADGRRHVIAIGGGMRVPEGKVPVHMVYAMRLTGRPEPRICVLNTAGGDDPRWALHMYERFAGYPARLSHLALFPMPNVPDPEDLLLSQDIIFVGGGSVANMLAVWRVHGLDQIMRKAWQAGIVLAGSSAGAICWFEGGTTDSFGHDLRAFTDGLGLLAGSYSPHHRDPARDPVPGRLRPSRGSSSGARSPSAGRLMTAASRLYTLIRCLVFMPGCAGIPGWWTARWPCC